MLLGKAKEKLPSLKWLCNPRSHILENENVSVCAKGVPLPQNEIAACVPNPALPLLQTASSQEIGGTCISRNHL